MIIQSNPIRSANPIQSNPIEFVNTPDVLYIAVMCIWCFQWIFIGIGNPIGRFGRIGRFRSSNESCALETSNQILYYWNWPLEDSNTASNPSNTTSNTFQSQIYIDNLKILFNYNK